MLSSKSSGEVFNVGSTEIHEMGYFTDLLIEIAGFSTIDIKKVVSEKLYRPIDINIQKPDVTKLVTTIDWIQEYTLTQTMESLFEYWYKKLR